MPDQSDSYSPRLLWQSERDGVALLVIGSAKGPDADLRLLQRLQAVLTALSDRPPEPEAEPDQTECA